MSVYQKNMRKLRLLMWKQFHLRKNRWILSLIELLLPILIVLLISKSAEDIMTSKGMERMNATVYPDHHASAILLTNSFYNMVYTPKSPALLDLMEIYRSQFRESGRTMNLHSVENETALVHLLGNSSYSSMGIVFKEFSALNDVNGVLSYVLRSSQDITTDELYVKSDGMRIPFDGPISEDPYMLRGFACVQLELNEAFAKYKNKSPIYDKILLQPFPYPEYLKENPFRSSIPTIVCVIVLITAVILAIPLITAIIEEKTSGVKELMKIVGMEEWLIWFGWLLHALIFSLITYTIVTYLLQHEFSGPHSAAIRSVNPTVLWSYILLYCVANIAFCFMFAAIFHQTTVASSMYVLTLAVIIYGCTSLSEMKWKYLWKVGCLAPGSAFWFGFNRIKYTEVHDMYLGWHNLFSSSPSTLSLGFVFLMMIFDTFLYMFLAFYISAINPGKFGARKSPFFLFDALPFPILFRRKMLRSALNKNHSHELVNLDDPAVDKFIEKPPSNLEATIKIKDLHKNFGSVYAVKGVNLNVYKGEITALLGHNGAGKTTTLAILTGLIKPTEGSITYKDKLDVLKKMDDFRDHLGMCPQEDRLFPYLTVLDHLLFFGQLKGASKMEALKEAKEYMKLMEIDEKASSLVATLSGGMKRKLCLSIALMGKAETLILDEPTSGLDVESRRKLWDLLLMHFLTCFMSVLTPHTLWENLAKINDPLEKSLQIDYNLYRDTKVMVQNTSGSEPIWESFKSQLQPYDVGLIYSEEKDIVEGLLKYGRQDLGSYKHDIILAMEWNGGYERDIKLLYNRFAIHSAPLGLGLFANHVTRYRDKSLTEIVMTSHPLKVETEMRGSRTIILTTHYMEEADALGDRIAIMHHGTIVCHGTSLFLKKSYNTGYQVTITKNESASEPQITDIIQNSGVKDVSLEGTSSTEVVYKLPLTETSKFSDLFRNLENSRDQLGVESIGVSCTTMEQVFLKVGGASMYDPKSSRRGSTVTDGGTASKLMLSKTSGITLMLQQIYALVYKKFLFTTRNWLNLFFRVVFPTLMMILLLQGARINEPSEKSLQIDFNLYRETKVMVQNTSGSEPIWESFKSQLQPYDVELIYSEEKDIVQGLLKYGRQDLGSYKHDIILAMEWNGGDERDIKLLYNRFAIHSVPLGLGLFANHVTRYRDQSRTEIVMTSHPLKMETDNNHGNEGEMIGLVVLWFILLAFYTIDLNTYFMTMINVERLDGFKHIQLMSKVSPIVYWLSNIIFDYGFFFLILIVRVMLFKFTDDANGFLTIDHHFLVLMFIFSLFIVSCLLFTYVLSYLSNSKDGSYFLAFLLNILSAIVVVVLFLFNQFFESGNLGYGFWAILYRVGNYIVLLIPPMNYSLIFLKFFFNWYNYKSCLEKEHNSVPCKEPSYLAFSSPENSDGVQKEVWFLVFDTFLYAGLLSIIQLGYFEKLVNKALIKIYGSSLSRGQNVSEVGDDDVQAEKAEVNRIVTKDELTKYRVLRKRNSNKLQNIELIDAEPSEKESFLRGNSMTSGNVLIAHSLRKNFIKLFRPFTAVADVNFSVKAGECFGLLGVNGAGKSTTFRMLTGDLLPTKGSSSILGKTLTSNRTEYLSKAGYCAQSNCFLEDLSGREMLSLVASLRGIRSNELKDTVDKWLNILGLEEYQNQRSGGYSGGNKRKLCTAMSLIGDPAVVFLDEPTSGVDPVARRRLYSVMEQSRECGQAVVLTSHSMEECENLCDRLTILVKGRMQCIGTAQHLKQTYAQGFSILVKISDTATSEALSTLKLNIENEFNQQCVLKDAHKTQLYYQITNVDLLWSTLFEKMEKLKESNKVIMDDYSLSDTSLEEVFISFAKN